MKLLALCCFAFGMLVLRPCDAAAQKPPVDGLIVPGNSVAGVELGSDFASFEAVFPKHPGLDEDFPDTQCGAGRVYHWLDMDKRATGIYVYLKSQKIYQFSVQTPRFAISNGIKVGASEKQVKAAYPQGRGYVLLGSGALVVGGRNLIYWVDKDTGVAFEFYWDHITKRRLVRAIDVFSRETDYRPQGCISPPQEWKELAGSQESRYLHVPPMR